MDLLEKKIGITKHRHPWETARYSVLLDLLKRYDDKSNASIIDVGCGDAFIVKSLAREFPDNSIIGIDTAFTNSDLEQFYSDNNFTNLSLKTDMIEIKSTEEVKYVLLMDVIEHIEDDIHFVKNVRNKAFVNKQTTFIITVPAFNSLYSAHDKFLKHYRRYNRKALVKLVENSGFEILESNYLFSTLLIIRILQKSIEIIFGNKEQKGLHHEEFSKSKANAVKRLLLLDYKIFRLFNKLGIKIPGLSTYVVCRIS